MHDVSIAFEKNSWWILAGFLVISAAALFIGNRTLQGIRLIILHRKFVASGKFGSGPPKEMSIAMTFQTAIYLFIFIGGIWILNLFADQAFFSFTNLERKNNQITFNYYFNRSRKFQWQDIQQITKERYGKNHNRIRFVMRNGQQLKSIPIDDDAVLADALSLKNDITVTSK